MPAERSIVTRSEIGGVIATAAVVDAAGGGAASSAGAVHANSTASTAIAGHLEIGFAMQPLLQEAPARPDDKSTTHSARRRKHQIGGEAIIVGETASIQLCLHRRRAAPRARAPA